MDRVTDILKRNGLRGDIPYMTPEQQEYYMNRGTQIHAACCMVDRGTLIWEKLDPRIVGHVRAYEKFLHDAQPELLASELEVVSKKYDYMGHLDRVFRIGKGKVVCDLKTGTVDLATRLQTIAYRMAYTHPIATCNRMGLALHENGTYRAHWWIGPALDGVDRNGWLACLSGNEWELDKWKQIVGWKEKKG
jgi:hypothetical protein